MGEGEGRLGPGSSFDVMVCPVLRLDSSLLPACSTTSPYPVLSFHLLSSHSNTCHILHFVSFSSSLYALDVSCMPASRCGH